MNKLIIAALFLCAACGTKDKKSETAEWKELDSFHKVMASVFHPLKDSGNLAPVRQMAAQLAEEAAHLATSALPEKINNEEMKSKLEQLKNDSKVLADEIAKGAADDAVKEKLNSLHEQFHKIMESWAGGSHHHEGEHEHHDDDDDDEHEHED